MICLKLPTAKHCLESNPTLLITKVKLEDIKNHAAAEFTFQPGVIAICGPNGSGKTTILEAIAWALFDHLEYKRDDFVRRGARRGKVVVSFVSDLDEREYEVIRDTGTGYYVYDPVTKTRLLEQKKDVLPWLRQHLKVEPETDLAALFKSTIGVPQGSFTHDFTLSPANRKTIFDQILKVEEYRKASDNLRETIRHIEGHIVEADKQVAAAEGELKAYDETKHLYDETGQRVQSLESENRQAAENRAQTATLLAHFDQLQHSLEARRNAIERLQVKLEVQKESLVTACEPVEQSRKAAQTVAAAQAGYETYLAASTRLTELERQRHARDVLQKRQTTIEHDLIEARSLAKMAEQRLDEVTTARHELEKLAESIQSQAEIERGIASLRERRGELQSLHGSLAAFDRELEKLHQRYSALSLQFENASSQIEKAAQAEALENDQRRLDAEINRKELAIGNFRLKRDHLESLRKELARLNVEQEKNLREASKLEKLTEMASKLAGLELRQQHEAEHLAGLRAEVDRDETMIRALESGGVCPLLTEKCLNLQPGESLDSRFRTGLETRRSEIESLSKMLTGLAKEMKQARAAATETARLPHLQSELQRLATDVESRERQIVEIEAETASGASLSDDDVKKLKAERTQLEKQLREAHEAQRLASQAEVLKNEMAGITAQVERKRADRELTANRMAEIGDIESRIAKAEEHLHQLHDPRSRAAALNQVIEGEARWKSEAESAGQAMASAGSQFDQIKIELQAFASLDSDLAATSQMRSANESDYHAFIQNKKTADTFEARRQELSTIESEIEETEKLLALAITEQARLETEYDAEAHQRAQLDLEQWRERSTQLATQLEHAKQQLDQLTGQLARLEEVRQRLHEHLKAKEKAQTLRETADFIREILQKAAPYITEMLLRSISTEANLLFREITGRFDITLHWVRDYEITLEEEGRERPFLNLSGGEQMAAALSVRLALLKELSEINLAFFDEPTTNMDEERRRNLAQQIGRIKDFHQLFVISHDDSFEGFTDQIVLLGQ